MTYLPTISPLQQKTILLIDDEKVMLLGLSTMLSKAGYRVLTANNGRKGIRLAEEHGPDLIVCDVSMPDSTGFQVRETLAKGARTFATPFIFLTSRRSPTDKLHGLELGADDYIIKPFNRAELLARIKAVLRRVTLEQQKAQLSKDYGLTPLRQQMIQNICHELRTPVHIILGELQLALVTRQRNLPIDQQEFMQTVLANTEQLKNIITDLLLLNQIDSATFDTSRQPLDPDEHFYPMVGEIFPRWQAKRQLELNMHVDPDMLIYLPILGFQHAVRHLLDNACKFSPYGGEIDMSLTQDGHTFLLTIVNQGKSISPELREKVFERFFQVSQGFSREYEGLGLGLTIARAFARSLDGDVVILDAEHGCHVQMSIPNGDF